MTLKISGYNLVPRKHAFDSYEVVITTMSGDADAYNDRIVGPFERNKTNDMEALEHLLKTLNLMEAAYPNGRGGSGDDEYDHVEGFDAWFGESELSEEPENEIVAAYLKRHNLYLNWPYEPWGDCQQSANKHKVLYYDDELDEYDVEVEILP